jgi:serine/threonine-protein kinase
MAEPTAEKLAQRAFDANLLSERQMQEIWSHFGRKNIPVEELLQFLLRREFLTNWQADRLYKGEKTGYYCGDFKLLYLVGTGTFSRVYRAVHRVSGQVVAVKLLRRRFSEDAAQAEQFLREGRVGLQLRHPNIVSILDVQSKGSTHFLVMEFIEGQSLREFLKVRKKIEPVYATKLFIDILNGICHAYDRGVSHRDLKLSNVLISSVGQAKLVDFGLAGLDEKFDDPLDIPNQRTVDYVGLERASGVRKDDSRSDIYFLGCMYYHVLTGQSPLLETKDRVQRLSRARFMEVVPINKVDPTLPRLVVTVVTRAMELTATLRYQTPGEMLAELHLAARRMAEESTDGESTGHDSESLFQMWGDSARKVLMFVESNQQMQDILRTGLKRSGYRVLMTRDPQRAIERIVKDPQSADCVVFSTLELGEPALEAFNRFGSLEETKNIPAVLLVGEQHTDLVSRANAADTRLVITSPIKLKEFRAALYRIVPPTPKTAKQE